MSTNDYIAIAIIFTMALLCLTLQKRTNLYKKMYHGKVQDQVALNHQFENVQIRLDGEIKLRCELQDRLDAQRDHIKNITSIYDKSMSSLNQYLAAVPRGEIKARIEVLNYKIYCKQKDYEKLEQSVIFRDKLANCRESIRLLEERVVKGPFVMPTEEMVGEAYAKLAMDKTYETGDDFKRGWFKMYDWIKKL